MSEELQGRVMQALGAVIDPDTGKDVVSSGLISSVQFNDQNHVVIIVTVDPARGSALEGVRQEIEKCAGACEGVVKASAILTAEKAPDKTPPAPSRAKADPHGMEKNPPLQIPAKNIIVIASGKGGVGKSTLAANIAAGIANFDQLSTGKKPLLKRGLRVGLLDADIYGPSQPLMMGNQAYKPELNKKKQLIPMEAHGLKIMSIGFMVDQEKALIWRGPMAQSAFYQLLRDVEWGDEKKPLDYLIIDMPPGTGDVQLTLAQKVKVDGAVIVSTPQDVALIDARRAVEMFSKTDIPVLGVVENMSYYTCSQCGHEEHIFGHDGAQEEAKRLGVPFLGGVPLSKNVRLQADQGVPAILSEPESVEAQSYLSICSRIVSAFKS